MGNLGVPELVVIFILALVIFGPRKLPELGRTLGKALAEFRKQSTDVRRAFEEEMRELDRQAREVESTAKEVANVTRETVALPDLAIGFGSVDSQGSTPPIPPEPTELTPGEKPADGNPKPA